jgi:hypothetical protein
MKRAAIRRAADWVLPPRIFEVLTTFSPRKLAAISANQSAFAANRALQGRHNGERCFIVGNGPSLREQDVRPLANELVITVSNGFLHKDFAAIAPRYHCVPEISRPSLPEDQAAEWLRRMDDRLSPHRSFWTSKSTLWSRRKDFHQPRVLLSAARFEQIFPVARTSLRPLLAGSARPVCTDHGHHVGDVCGMQGNLSPWLRP